MNDDIHALSGAYAIDAVDQLERARFERHLSACSDCRHEVDSLRAAAGELGHLAEVMPPARLREQVLLDIAKVRPLPPRATAEAGARIEVTRQPPREAGRPTRRVPSWLAAAAAVVIIGGGTATLVAHPWDRTSQSQLSVADKVLADPNATRKTQQFPGGASAEVVSSKSLGKAVLVTRGMASAPTGKVYQAWFQQGESFAPAGIMSSRADQTLLLDGNASTATAVGITVEPDGGSPSPTSDPIALIRIA
ncbi:MAG: anti-sigma factor [Lapillicoccus sp.]